MPSVKLRQIATEARYKAAFLKSLIQEVNDWGHLTPVVLGSRLAEARAELNNALDELAKELRAAAKAEEGRKP